MLYDFVFAGKADGPLSISMEEWEVERETKIDRNEGKGGQANFHRISYRGTSIYDYPEFKRLLGPRAPPHVHRDLTFSPSETCEAQIAKIRYVTHSCSKICYSETSQTILATGAYVHTLPFFCVAAMPAETDEFVYI